MKTKQFYWVIVLAIVGALLIAACGPSVPEPPAVQAEQAEHDDDNEHADEAGHSDEAASEDSGGHAHSPDDHMAGAHNVPAEAAAVPNPIAADSESMAAGEQLFATNCALCHGEGGLGDGPAAVGLDKPPANLNEAHVQELSDGSLFYIISHGKPDTPMPAWDKVLNEEERWHVVNHLRIFNGDETASHAEGDHDEEGEHAEGDGN
jgi:mono/diheme cytochrome c family protein